MSLWRCRLSCAGPSHAHLPRGPRAHTCPLSPAALQREVKGGQGVVQPRWAPLQPLWGRSGRCTRRGLRLKRCLSLGGWVLQGVLAAVGMGQCGVGVPGARAQPPGLALHWDKAAAFSS